jgi:hypothetical protein
MSKLTYDFDPEAYATVAERIRLFYAAYPLGRIQTELVSRTSHEVVFKALLYRTPADDRPAATGWAAEREGDGEINLVACLENTETSAIGRALANLGFTASRERPSREEMSKVARVRERLGTEGGAKADDSGSSGKVSRNSSLASIEADPLQREANYVADALDLIRAAERLGLRAARGNRLRAGLLDGSITREAREQWMSVLRRWIQRRRADALKNPYDS